MAARNPIESPEAAQPAASDEEKVAAVEAEAAAAAESAKNAHNERFVEYVVPRRIVANRVDPKTGKPLASRKSSDPHAHAEAGDGSYRSRVGIGLATAKMSAQDWADLGIAGDTTTVWNFDNNWRVPAAVLSPEQAKYLIEDDRRYNGVRFELVDGNGNKVDQ